MIKKTLYIENPAYISLKNKQLLIKLPDVEKNDRLPESFKAENVRTIPIEDIGVVVLDNKQITITHGLIEALLENNCAIVTCDSRRMPVGLLLPLEGNTIQNERFRAQIEASLPLKKQLWQQTVQAKIENQAAVLKICRSAEVRNMLKWVEEVRSGDADNMEARAAAYYWRNLFPDIEGFVRGREEMPPNNLLNYGYAILRAVVARALVASGLLPTLGIHHHNRYNAYCLADDIMEPYRPFVDKLVVEITNNYELKVTNYELTKDVKAKLLQIPVLDVMINGQRSPLMIAAGQTTASLAKCYSGELRKIVYPDFE
ncbi:MAG: type II CRISPR-associated endonuclease Cas1 [Bacteroidales bacterium]|nr:type II CRISPR-associated endonuclease Cas1 [Bacteroidales bacterium]